MKQSGFYNSVSTLLIGLFFEAAANDLDELTETVTSYISFCEDVCIPTRTHLTTTKTNHSSLQNSDSSVSPKKMLTERGIKSRINSPNTHWKRRSEWQRGIILANYGTNYLPVILLQCGKVWKTSLVTRHHPLALWRINNWQTIWMSSIAGLKKHHSHLLQPPHPAPALQISEDDMR